MTFYIHAKLYSKLGENMKTITLPVVSWFILATYIFINNSYSV